MPRARRDALLAVADHLPVLRPGDLDTVTAEFAAVARAFSRRNVRWGRIAVASAAGLALGVATMGVAAPLIGAAVGSALGLSGAAATSAGLAALGGGSMAAGGFGMAGGTALLTGLGAIGGAGAAAAGSRVSGWSVAQVVARAAHSRRAARHPCAEISAGALISAHDLRDTARVTYDADMADRLREILAVEPDVREKAMFGGLAFMVAGHMAVSASGRGGLLLRVDPAETDALITDPRASRFVMRGREMDGWLHVDIEADATDEELRRWVRLGVAHVRSLPPK